MGTIAQPNKLCYKVATWVTILQSWFREWPEFPMAVQFSRQLPKYFLKLHKVCGTKEHHA